LAGLQKKSEHLTIGLAFVAQIKYPDAFIELDARNKRYGLGSKNQSGHGIMVSVLFSEKETMDGLLDCNFLRRKWN
jgi:hypothetical protein